MKLLERGGAAASMLERLRETEWRLESLEATPETMLACREEALLGPLLGWVGPDAALRSAVEALGGDPGSPPENTARPVRTPMAPSPPSVEGGVTELSAKAGLRAWRGAPAGEIRERTPLITPDDARRRLASTCAADPHTARAWHQPVSGAPGAPRVDAGLSTADGPARHPGQALPEDRPGRRSGMKAPLNEPRELAPPVTAEQASRRLASAFADDERTARAWHQPVSTAPGPPRVAAILHEPEPRHPNVIDTPRPDPVSVRLQTVVDRAWRACASSPILQQHTENIPNRTLARGTGNEFKSTRPPPRRLVSPADVSSGPADEEPLDRPFGEPRRESGLRRLATFGGTIETDRALPSPAVPSEAPTRGTPVTLERADLAQEVADIFRREALRHGIVPEEDAP